MSLALFGVFPGIPALLKPPVPAPSAPPKRAYARTLKHPGTTTYDYRRANGLCTRCGDPCDREGRRECSVCRSIDRMRAPKGAR